MTSDTLLHEFSDLAETLSLVGEDGEVCREEEEEEEEHHHELGEAVAMKLRLYCICMYS